MNQVQLLGGILYWRLNPRNNSNFITLTTTTEKIQSAVTAAIFLKFGRHSCSCYFIHRLIFVIEDVTETAAWPSLRVRNWSKKNLKWLQVQQIKVCLWMEFCFYETAWSSLPKHQIRPNASNYDAVNIPVASCLQASLLQGGIKEKERTLWGGWMIQQRSFLTCDI